MGASNVKMVFTHWNHLKHRDKVGLLFMANKAHDAHDPPRYWGGWEAIAEGLGLELGDHDDTKAHANASEQVRRVMASLAKAGVVVSSARARTHVRAEYALALDPSFTFKPIGSGRDVSWERVDRSTNSTEKVGQVPTEKVPLIPPKRCPTFHRKGGNSPTEKVPPRKEPQEQVEEQLEEKPKRAHPIPNDFTMTPEREAWAKANTPAVNARLQTDDFIDYWKNGDGAGKTKKNWEATWRNRMRDQQKHAEFRGWKPPEARAQDLYNPANW